MTYLDTSALVKRFIAERGSARVHALMVEESRLATAKIAYVETYAALNRRQRAGHISRVQYTLFSQRFEEQWQGFMRIGLDDSILMLARHLTQRYPLRAYDAIHLASAMRLQDSSGQGIVFAAADERLLQAAAAERLRCLHVEEAV